MLMGKDIWIRDTRDQDFVLDEVRSRSLGPCLLRSAVVPPGNVIRSVHNDIYDKSVVKT